MWASVCAQRNQNSHGSTGGAHRLRYLSQAAVRASGLSEPVCTLSFRFLGVFFARNVANVCREKLRRRDERAFFFYFFFLKARQAARFADSSRDFTLAAGDGFYPHEAVLVMLASQRGQSTGISKQSDPKC